MNRESKEILAKEFGERMASAKGFVLAGYRGMSVAEVNGLRKNLRANGSWMKVIKNRLLKRIFAEKGWNELSDYVFDPTVVAATDQDSTGLAKILAEYAKKVEKLNIRGGFFEGKKITKVDIDVISKLPSKEVMLSRALSSMISPASNFVGVLSALPRNLVCALNAIKEKKTA